MFVTQILSPSDFAAANDWLAVTRESQSIVGARCLHSDFDVLASTVANANAEEMFYFGVRDATTNDALGVYGAEVAEDLQRAWLRGPFVAASHIDRFDDIANAAFDAMFAQASARVNTWDAYVETSHERAISWLLSRGFVSLKVNSVYIAKREYAKFDHGDRVHPPTPEIIDAVVALTQEAFPGGYLTRKDFETPPSNEAITLVMTEGNRLLGCVHASREGDNVEAYVDYLVVAKEHRGRGIGRMLLGNALAWAFAQAGVAQVALTVLEDNSAATSLYESVGFELLANGRHLRLKTNSNSDAVRSSA
jgi:ribosomal protein S18 acetylase RimI-like enzyme